ncbi:MAG: DUF5110 domain-containing protein, partial [Asticcacaulis sp.]
METPSGALELHVWPGEDCHGSIYADDGQSFAYKHGVFLRQSVHCDANTIRFDAREGSYRPWWNGITVVIHGWEGAAPRVTLNGNAVPAQTDATAKTASFTVPDMAKATEVTIAH